MRCGSENDFVYRILSLTVILINNMPSVCISAKFSNSMGDALAAGIALLITTLAIFKEVNMEVMR